METIATTVRVAHLSVKGSGRSSSLDARPARAAVSTAVLLPLHANGGVVECALQLRPFLAESRVELNVLFQAGRT